MEDFFADKIHTIHEELGKIQDDSISFDPDTPFDVHGSPLTDFSAIKEEDAEKIIQQAALKFCCLDPVPTKIVKECFNLLVPFITRMINQSCSSGYVPRTFKLAALIPLLKKANLIPEIFKNFRPISNLPFYSKVMEKVAAKQLCCHKEVNKMREKMQSAYCEYHSSKTALLKIHHDLMMSMDRKNCVLMVMLDLLAACDTVHHNTLLDCLSL